MIKPTGARQPCPSCERHAGVFVNCPCGCPLMVCHRCALAAELRQLDTAELTAFAAPARA